MKKFLLSLNLLFLLFSCTSDNRYNLYEVCTLITFDELKPVQEELYVEGNSVSQVVFNDFSDELRSIPEDGEFTLSRATLGTNAVVTLVNLRVTTSKGDSFTLVSNDTQLPGDTFLDLEDIRSGHTTLSLLVAGYEIPGSINLRICFESLVKEDL